jgi:hypothetical protein
MRNLVSFITILVLVTLFSSCGKDADNEKFIGKFTGEVNCIGEGEYPTTLDISVKDKSDTKVNIILDSDGEIVSLTGAVDGNSIVIDKIEVEDDSFLSGKGSLAGNVLTVTFTQESDPNSDDCIFIGSK